jgi:hypothetical protein
MVHAKVDPRVYIYNNDDMEIEVDMELLEDGYPYGLMLHNGEEVLLTNDEQERARDAYALMVEAYEDARGDYYGEY